jgi:hypothetical protein
MPSQMPSTQTTSTQKLLSSVPAGEREKLVNDLVQYLLIQDYRKIPIKKQDINKCVLKDNAKLFSWAIERAETKIREVFGIRLIEMKESKQKCYMLISMLDNDSENPHQRWSDEDHTRTGLLMFILSLIYMNGKTVQDTVLFHTLKRIGVDVDSHHEVFGDIRRLITTDLPRLGYIEIRRDTTADPPTCEMLWGERAEHEVTKRSVLDFIAQIYDNEPADWTSQWQEIQRTEPLAAEPMHE